MHPAPSWTVVPAGSSNEPRAPTRSIQPYLPTHYWLKFVDFYRDPILWRDVNEGIILQLVYVVVFLGAAWASFTTKDITS